MLRESVTTKLGGTGLGLLSARDTLARWGGELTIHSEPGSGTTVTLTLRE